MRIELDWPVKELSQNSRCHWSVKAKATKAYRKACWALTKQAGIAIDWEGDIHLWITFYPPNKRRIDDDNLIGRFKAGRDGIADALGIDDSRFRTHPWVSTETRPGGKVVVGFTGSAEYRVELTP